MSVTEMRDDFDRPLVRLRPDDGMPEWQQVVGLFKSHGLSEPPWRLRDELVSWLMWARYAETLETRLSPTPSDLTKGAGT